jgi:hypothetical protein
MIPLVNTTNLKYRNNDSLFIKWFHPLSEILENNFTLGAPLLRVISEFICSTHYLKKYKVEIPNISKDLVPKYFSLFGMEGVDLKCVRFDSSIGVNLDNLKKKRISISHKIQLRKEELVTCVNCKTFEVLFLSEYSKSGV